MGCPATKQADTKTIKNDQFMELIVLIKRLNHEFQMQVSMLIGKVKHLKLKLRQSINMNKMSRSKDMEYSLLEEITLSTHLRQIYESLILHCRCIQDRQQFIPQILSTGNANNSKSILKNPIQTLLFSISIINDGKLNLKNTDIQKFHKFFLVKTRSIQEPNNTDNNLLNYYKSNPKPNHPMIKETVFAFCEEEGITASKFHEIGLNFTY